MSQMQMQPVCTLGVRDSCVYGVRVGCTMHTRSVRMRGRGGYNRIAGKKAKKEGAGNPAPSAVHLGRNQPLSVIRGEEISLLRIDGGYGNQPVAVRLGVERNQPLHVSMPQV